jgi:hypothetical protein
MTVLAYPATRTVTDRAGAGERNCNIEVFFKVSLFHAATILMLVAFDGFTLSPCCVAQH